MQLKSTERIVLKSTAANRFLLSLLVMGLASQASRGLAEDPQKGVDVQEVRIDNNSSPRVPAGGTAALGGAGGAPDDCDLYKQQIAELNKKYAVKRSELATALATVKLKIDSQKRIELVDNDEFEVLGVRFLEAESNGILTWTPLEALEESSDEPTEAAPAVPPSPAGGGMASNVPPPPALPAAPVEQRVIIKDKDITIESISPRGIKQLRVKRGQAESQNALAAAGNGPENSEPAKLERFQIQTHNVQRLTYQQPTAPWKLIYEQEGPTLRQWVKFSNFTPYTWKKGTKVTLSDLFSAEDNRTLELHVKADIPARSTALQLLKDFQIKEESYHVQLNDRSSLATKKLLLAFSGFLPGGDFRDTVLPSFVARTAEMREAADNEVMLKNEPSLLAVKNMWEVPTAQSVVGVNGSRFKIHSTRKTLFLLRNSGGVRSIKVSKEKTPGWRAVGSDWVEGAETYTQKFTLEGPDRPVELVEVNVAEYDFDTKDGRDNLVKVVQGWEDQPQGLGLLLLNCKVWQEQLEGTEAALKKAGDQIAELTARYESYDLGKDLSRDAEKRHIAKGMWERLNDLKSKASALEARKADLQVKLHSSLFPVSSN